MPYSVKCLATVCHCTNHRLQFDERPTAAHEDAIWTLQPRRARLFRRRAATKRLRRFGRMGCEVHGVS
jgi:hypothetical protein